jgi:ribosomal protein S27AE
MELLACPRCGSEWFVSARTGDRLVFQMDAARNPVMKEAVASTASIAGMDPERLCCGACTWQGSTRELVESRM